MRPRDKDSISLISLKQRMSHSVQPAERAISTSPVGTWLDGLRSSFEPETKEQRKPEPSPKPNVFAGRLRSV